MYSFVVKCVTVKLGYNGECWETALNRLCVRHARTSRTTRSPPDDRPVIRSKTHSSLHHSASKGSKEASSDDMDEGEGLRSTHCFCCCRKKRKVQKTRKTRFHGVVVSMYTQQTDTVNSSKSINIIKSTRRMTKNHAHVVGGGGANDETSDPFESERELSCWNFWGVLLAFSR